MLSVLMATRNRAASLRRTLDALTRLDALSCGWRLVVVDNGSSDGTADVLAGFRPRLPLTIIDEPRPGKSTALNAAIPAIRGDLIAFLDDDIVPEPDWLLRLAAAADAQPGYGVFGGRIEPLWEAVPPPWIRAWVDLALCYGAHGDMPEGACPYFLVFGGNMAVRNELFRRGLRFDAGFGPNGRRSYPIGEETEFVRRAELAGFRPWHCRSAVVRHFVPKAHMTERWLFDRARNFGRNQYLMDGPAIQEMRGGSDGETESRLRRAMRENRWRAWGAALGRKGEARFRALWQMNFVAGLALEHRAAMRRH